MLEGWRYFRRHGWRGLRDRLYIQAAAALPREFVYWCGMRILSEVTGRPRLSVVRAKFWAGDIRMLHALQEFVNKGRAQGEK